MTPHQAWYADILRLMGLSFSLLGVAAALWWFVFTYVIYDYPALHGPPPPVGLWPLAAFAAMALGFFVRRKLPTLVGLAAAALFSLVLVFSHGAWFVLPSLAVAVVIVVDAGRTGSLFTRPTR